MNWSRLQSLRDGLWRARYAVRWRLRKLRGLTGEFDHPEDSERSRDVTERWERNWPGAEPIGHLLRSAYSDRWVRFHSLPESKRYAESPEEYAEIIRRHRAVLSELLAGSPIESLVIVAEDWGSRDLATGWSRNHLPGAWPWRIAAGDEPDLGFHYLWVKTGMSAPGLDALLTTAADDQGHFLIAANNLDRLYCPYDGGACVILPTAVERDALRDRHPTWLSELPSGL